jgi:hypothetical protein
MESRRLMTPRKLLRLGASLLAACVAGLLPAGQAQAGEVIAIHEPPTDPAHRAAHDLIRDDAAFARSRAFFAAFNLPRSLTFVTRSCEGRGGAWYFDFKVTICYEYVQNLIDGAASAQRPAWVSAEGAVRGGIADVALHEGAHALFEAFRTPLLGKEEDAADMVATFAILNLFGAEAPAMVRGVAYSYLVDAQVRNFSDLPTLQARAPVSRAYGGAHSTALQRMFSIVCHASGFDGPAYADLVAASDLPRWRASGCEDEYRQIAHAFETLLGPHLNQERLAAAFPSLALALKAAKPER